MNPIGNPKTSGIGEAAAGQERSDVQSEVKITPVEPGKGGLKLAKSEPGPVVAPKEKADIQAGEREIVLRAADEALTEVQEKIKVVADSQEVSELQLQPTKSAPAKSVKSPQKSSFEVFEDWLEDNGTHIITTGLGAIFGSIAGGLGWLVVTGSAVITSAFWGPVLALAATGAAIGWVVGWLIKQNDRKGGF